MTNNDHNELFDSRVSRQRIMHGDLTQAQIDAHLASLPDDEAESELSSVQFIATTNGPIRPQDDE